MRPNELHPFLAEELSFPIDDVSVITRVGAIEIAAPDDADSEPIASVLARVDAGTFDSARELTSTIRSGLGPQYVGRRFYDDRGGQAPSPSPHQDGVAGGENRSL
jgi:hypothetical protein